MRFSWRSCVCFLFQGADVRSQLRDEECPLVDRVGAFAAALKMKKFWQGMICVFLCVRDRACVCVSLSYDMKDIDTISAPSVSMIALSVLAAH